MISTGQTHAFPVSDVKGVVQYGMTYRTWLVGQIAAGALYARDFYKDRDEDTNNVARDCVAVADAIIAELDKK